MADHDANMNDDQDRSQDSGLLPRKPRIGTLPGRRRLLKGAALAAPAVMTLRSGAALAATSATCLQHVTGSNPPQFLIPPNTEPGDTYARKPVMYRRYRHKTLAVPAEEVFQYEGESQWRSAVDATTVAADDAALDSFFEPTVWNLEEGPIAAKMLAIVNNDGAVFTEAGVSPVDFSKPYDTDHHPITHSCWFSVIASH